MGSHYLLSGSKKIQMFQKTRAKVFSKVLPFVHDGGPWGTVPELLFEKKGLIPALQQLLASAALSSILWA
jgi:hypothetical protein